jgi:hypothetical protein
LARALDVQFTVTVWLEAHKLAKEAEIKQAQDPNSVNENSESAKSFAYMLQDGDHFRNGY